MTTFFGRNILKNGKILSPTLPETNSSPMKTPIVPCKYHQNGGFSMAMLVLGRVVTFQNGSHFTLTHDYGRKCRMLEPNFSAKVLKKRSPGPAPRVHHDQACTSLVPQMQ